MVMVKLSEGTPQGSQRPGSTVPVVPVLLIQGLQQRRAPRRDAGAEDHVRLAHLGRARLGQGHVVLRTALLQRRSYLWGG